MVRKGGKTSVSFSTLSTLGTNNSLLFSVEIILMPCDENNRTNKRVRLSIQTRKEGFLKGLLKIISQKVKICEYRENPLRYLLCLTPGKLLKDLKSLNYT